MELHKLVKEAMRENSNIIADYISDYLDDNYTLSQELSDLLELGVHPYEIAQELVRLSSEKGYGETTIKIKVGEETEVSFSSLLGSSGDLTLKDLKRAFWSGKVIIYKGTDNHETRYHMDMTEEPIWGSNLSSYYVKME